MISFPVAWYTVYNWLHGYALRIAINPGLFILPFVIVMLIAFATVSYRSRKGGSNDRKGIWKNVFNVGSRDAWR